MANPIISLITPYNGSNSFRYFINSVKIQTLDINLFEVIIVNDTNTDLKIVLSEGDYSNNIKLINLDKDDVFKGHSAGISRNFGAKIAKGSLLVFVDSDCILNESCLENYLLAYQKNKDVIYYGLANELPAINWDELYSGASSFEELDGLCLKDHRIKDKDNEVNIHQKWNFWYSCNCSIPIEKFIEVGGFDKKGYRCHDMDLAYRLYKLGTNFEYLMNSRVIHIEHSRSIRSYNDQINGLKNLQKKFPELESYVFDQIILKERAQKRVAEKCEDNFVDIINDLSGIRMGYFWICKNNDRKSAILNRLLYIPFTVQERLDNTIFELRLDRNCWDYKIIIPRILSEFNPLVAVIIPMYNAGKRVLKALSSVMCQSIQNFEVIIVDDASNDDSVNFIVPYLLDNRIRLISATENKGLANSLNKGLEFCTAPIIIHLDSDDWLELNTFEKIISYFESDDDLGALYGNPIVHQEGEVISNLFGYQIASSIDLFSYSLYQVPRAYRKKALLKIGGWDISDSKTGRYYEDRLTLYRISLFFKIKNIDNFLYNVLDRNNSLSRKNPLSSASAKLAILWTEANKVNYLVQYNYYSNKLNASLLPIVEKEIEFKWSIIIPFHKYSQLLFYSIISWLQSDFRLTDSEILLIDDHSNEDLEKIIDLDRQRIKLFILPQKMGAAYARNYGVSKAKNEMIFFSDADHIVPLSILQKHEKHHLKSSENLAVVGCILGRRTYTNINSNIHYSRKETLLNLTYFKDEFARIASFFAANQDFDLIDRFDNSEYIWEKVGTYSFTDSWLEDWTKIIIKHGENLAGYKHKWTRLSSGSFSISKESFNILNGFTECLKSMEDWELGIRMQKSNIEIICSPESEPYHQIHPIDSDREMNDLNALNYLLSHHKEYINELLKEDEDFVTPAKLVLAKKMKKDLPDSNEKDKKIQKTGIYTSSSKYCMITFDDGPHPVITRKILNLLKEYNCKATFFVLGSRIENNEDLLNRIIEDGHDIGVHSWTHESSEFLTSIEVEQRLFKTIELIEKITGFRPVLARPPYGKLTPSYKRALDNLGLQPIGWTLSTKDWQAYSHKEVITRISTMGISGNVLLFHDGTCISDATINSLSWLLNICNSENIKTLVASEYCKLDELPRLSIFNPSNLF